MVLSGMTWNEGSECSMNPNRPPELSVTSNPHALLRVIQGSQVTWDYCTYSTCHHLCSSFRLHRTVVTFQRSINVNDLLLYLCFIAWAEKRGFKTAKAARNDVYRAANSLLRLAVDGRLCLCLRPSGYSCLRGKTGSSSLSS